MSTTSDAPPMSIGTPRVRAEARDKVTGAAQYSYERPQDGMGYGWIVGATIARGTVVTVDTDRALAAPGVVAVLTHENAPKLQPDVNAELEALQHAGVQFRGQPIALVVAETLEEAREAAGFVSAEYREEAHDVLLREDHPDLYVPEELGGGSPPSSGVGDPDAALAAAPATVDVTYRTPAEHNNPMEPHATTAAWGAAGGLTLYDSTQDPSGTRDTVAQLFGIDEADVQVCNEHVGGGFGSKGTTRMNAVLAAQAAKVTGRPVKLAVTRQQMFDLTGYRTPTIQRVRLGAETDGRLVGIAHHALGQTADIPGFLEPTTTPTRVLYAAAHRRTSQEVVELDVPTPSWMRAPGRCPGVFAIETAMDELATQLGIDPIVLRERNETANDPESGSPFSSRGLVQCLHEGARRFNWADRDPRPGVRLRDRKLIGTGVAGSTYPAQRNPAQATARALPGGTFEVAISASDIGTGARTVLGQIAADALGVEADLVTAYVGDSALPDGPGAGDSAGTASWGSAVHGACVALRRQLQDRGGSTSDPVEATWDTTDEIEAEGDYARHSFAAHFAEVEVDVDTGVVSVPRLLGVFACGRILNPHTAQSQFVGALIMGIGMALMEESTVDLAHGDFLNHDLAQYHVPANADVLGVEAAWIEEHDEHLNPMGSKGIGEIGIVGSPAAIGNAVFHATGHRFRELPLRPDRVLEALRSRTSS
ncbi:xanthine dehydrogenase family protein molybdopterin-binding subunit [Thermoleophilia bacterium SCSIO 60948]|nr:xanthine dehydrogenase family protein molybdopterin-binding subunit [Thermoleophilia bacterium SCSIO 60948]